MTRDQVYAEIRSLLETDKFTEENLDSLMHIAFEDEREHHSGFLLISEAYDHVHSRNIEDQEIASLKERAFNCGASC